MATDHFFKGLSLLYVVTIYFALLARICRTIVPDGDFATALPAFFQKHGRIVAKPVANGSSIGLHIIADEKSLQQAIEQIGKSISFGQFMVEKFIEG